MVGVGVAVEVVEGGWGGGSDIGNWGLGSPAVEERERGGEGEVEGVGLEEEGFI